MNFKIKTPKNPKKKRKSEYLSKKMKETSDQSQMSWSMRVFVFNLYLMGYGLF